MQSPSQAGAAIATRSVMGYNPRMRDRHDNLRDLVQRALARRAPLAHAERPATTMYRLIHGAGDGLPGFTVDRYTQCPVDADARQGRPDVVLVVNDYTQCPVGVDDPAELSPALLDALVEIVQPRAIYVKRRPPEAARLTEADVTTLAPVEPVWGTAVPEVAGLEAGLTYLVRPGAGLNVGLFLDMREVRQRVRAWSAGRTVLNTFSYTCAFGVTALAGGAARVLNVDLSRATLSWGQDNYRANGLPADPYDFVYGDVFDWLGRLARRGQTFEMVILDPPSFSRARGRRFQAARDYGQLVTQAAGVLSPGGLLLACCNLAKLSPQAFRRQVLAGLAEAGRSDRVIDTYHEPAVDFPVAPGRKPYLKVLAVEVKPD